MKISTRIESLDKSAQDNLSYTDKTDSIANGLSKKSIENMQNIKTRIFNK